MKKFTKHISCTLIAAYALLFFSVALHSHNHSIDYDEVITAYGSQNVTDPFSFGKDTCQLDFFIQSSFSIVLNQHNYQFQSSFILLEYFVDQKFIQSQNLFYTSLRAPPKIS